jgi:hypothetical protein
LLNDDFGDSSLQGRLNGREIQYMGGEDKCTKCFGEEICTQETTLKDLGIDVRLILRRNEVMLTGFICMKTETRGGLL